MTADACPECGAGADDCSWAREHRGAIACCPDCRHYRRPPPPGAQLHLYPRPLPRFATRWRTVTRSGTWSPWQPALALAALQAGSAAAADGEAWLVADDQSYAHLEADGPRIILNPYTGWAVTAARTITQRSTTP